MAAEEGGEKADELQVYADFLRIVLEILNCIIVTNLPANPELVYAMLHQQEIFMPFQVCFSLHLDMVKSQYCNADPQEMDALVSKSRVAVKLSTCLCQVLPLWV